MLALVLKHNATVGRTPPGIVILHETHDPVMLAATPLSKVLLRDYSKGFRLYVYDRKVYARREKVVPPKNLETFLKIGVTYYANAKMELEKMPYDFDETKIIEIDGTVYKLEDVVL